MSNEANWRILSLKGNVDGMGRKRYMPEQIINMFRETEVAVLGGHTVGEVCRSLGSLEQSNYRWRSECGAMKPEQVKRLKEPEKENIRLKRAAVELTLEKLTLTEVAEGNG